MSNLNEDEMRADMGIMMEIGTRKICTYQSSYSIEKFWYYPYPYLVNAGFPVKTGMDSDNTHRVGLFIIPK